MIFFVMLKLLPVRSSVSKPISKMSAQVEQNRAVDDTGSFGFALRLFPS